LAKFWKLYTTWIFSSSTSCLIVCTLYGSINYVTHFPRSKSKCKTESLTAQQIMLEREKGYN
jgi:hypothetical protein